LGSDAVVADVKLTSEEIAVLRAALSKFAIRGRTGELGVLHGLDRFVSTQLILKKQDRDVLNAIASKVGLRSINEVK
jgi:hypothetical protein